ncbi:uncharacterized protein LOC108671995 [Hyalella azteca]|uniref:Uncharacterized protein LOC108671995 n=1 Tax=Hyalella azteca TaxID=294128 RepID=A0A979FL02_HYAAZ|nr:uncharacterized protein LOC108671995 [Hyalella azteca]
MKFVHPLHYRMHCSVFHDPNYSLTIRKYHCKVCGLAVLGKENIMRHAAEQHEGRGAYQCQFCKKFFLRLHSLDMHVTYSCSRNPARVFPLCDYCGKKFCQPQHLRSHQKRMHADMSEVLREFQCKMCFKILGSRAALQRHLKEVHHKVSGGKEDLSTGATCDRCGKMFQNKSNLKIHMLTHSGVKPFKCIESGCNAAFTTKQCLQFHYKKVHGYTGDGMPKIERCIPYTFDSYSGGLVPDPGRGKIPPMPSSLEQTSVISNPNSPSQSLDMTQTTMPLHHEEPPISPMTSDSESHSRQDEVLLDVGKLPPAATLHGYVAKYAAAATRLVSKGSRKWLGDSLELYDRDQQDTSSSGGRDIYDFEERIDSDLQRRREKEELIGVEDERLLRRESNASLLVEAALSVAELRGYGSGRCSPTLQTSQSDQLQLPHEAALATHIRYTTSEDEHRHLGYTLEREYDPRSLPEVMVVQDNLSQHDLNDQLHLDTIPSSSSNDSVTPLSSATLSSSALSLTLSSNSSLATSLSPSSPLPVALPPSSTVLSSSLVSSTSMEPSLHVLEELPALDMTYKQYRIVPETSVSHDHLLAATPLDENSASMGLEVLTSSGSSNIVTVMSPSRHDHLSEQLPLPELQPHDFRGLPALKSPDGQRSPTYLSSSPTHDVLRTYLIPSDALRSSSFTLEQGVDMSRTNLFIRYTSDPSGTQHRTTTIYELDRPPSHSLDLTLPRADHQRDLSPLGPLSRSLSPDPQLSPGTTTHLSPHHHLSPSEHEQGSQNHLTLYTQLSSHVQLPPYSHITTLNQMSPGNRPDSVSPDVNNMDRIPISSHSPPDTTMTINSSNGPPLPPISRIVSTSQFYSSRSILPRHDFSPTTLPSYSEPLLAGESSSSLTTVVAANKERSSSPYSQYPNSPYQRYQDLPSPPSYQYQYY